METNQLILLAALGLGGFALYRIYQQPDEPRFYVPGVGYVPVSELPTYGYQNVGGNWYSDAQVNAAAGQVGLPPGTTVSPGTQTFLDIVAILQTVAPLVSNVITTVTGSVNKQQVIQQILANYNDPNHPAYYTNPNDRYTQQQLGGMTNQQLQDILNYGYTINGIHAIGEASSDYRYSLNGVLAYASR